MGAIVLDANKINSYVLPNLSKSENTMQTAYNTSVSFKNSLPSSFYYRSTVNDIVSQIYKIQREIKDVDKIIETKVDRAKSIQKKADSKVSSLSSAVSKVGAITAAIGSATIGSRVGGVGAAVGAAAGAVVASTTVKKDNKTGAKQSKSFLSKVGDFFVGAWNGIKKTASKISNGIKSIWQKFTGAIKNIGKKVVDATKKVGKAIYSTGAKIAKGVVSGVKKIGSAIVDGFKWVGSKVVSGVKTAAKWVGNTAKTVTNWIADKFNAVKDWTCNALKSAGAWISKTANAAWTWIKGAASTVWTHMKKIGASFVNGVISLVKGVVKLVEAIGDLVILVGAGIGTIGTAIWDTVKGIATGKWDWSATKGLWKGTKAVVAYDWTSKCIFDPLYNTSFGKWLDDNAYSPFKSTGLGCKILEGVGYVGGVVVISIFTFGAGGVVIGTTASIGGATVSAGAVAITAAAAGIGKYTEEEWNKNSLSITYGGQEVGLTIDYQKYCEIEKLGDGESATITQQFTDENGNPFELKFKITKNGDTYSVTDGNGNAVGFNGVTESSTVKGLGIGALKGLGDGLKAYTAVSTLGNVQTFVGAASKVGGGNFLKGTASIVKDFGAKESMKTIVKTSAKNTFKDVGFYIDSGTHIYTDVKSGIETGDWNLLKTGAKIAGAYGINFLGNLGGNISEDLIKNAKVQEAHALKQAEYDELFSTPEAQSYLDRNEALADYNTRQREYDELFSTPEAQKYLDNNEHFIDTRDEYIDKVIAKKLDDERWDYAKQHYDENNGEGEFYKLTKEEQNNLKLAANISTEASTLKYKSIAEDTVDSIHELKITGKIKPEYSEADVLEMIESGVPQEKYLTEAAVTEWRNSWSAKDGMAEVYCFQDSANSYALKEGVVGRPPTDGSTLVNAAGDGGAFVMTKSQYEALLENREIFDSSGNCIDVNKLSKELGGVKFNGTPISIKQTVPVDSIEMPMGNNQGAFLGEWRPGGKTSGGVVEGVVPQNFTADSGKGSTIEGTLVEIIKH